MPSIMVVDTYYPRFLNDIGYGRVAGTGDRYETLRDAVFSHRFGVSNAYSFNFRKLGWDAEEIIPNSVRLQSAWAHERGMKVLELPSFIPPSHLARLPGIGCLLLRLPVIQRILIRQVEERRPDVLYMQDLNFVPPSLLRAMRRSVGLVVGQIASPLPPRRFLKEYDLIVSSLPNLLDRIKCLGIPTAFLPLAFDDRLAAEIPDLERDIPLSFVGGISRRHSATIPLLAAAQKASGCLSIYGYGADSLVGTPSLRAIHHGEVWGVEMYRILRRSRVTLNRHIDLAGSYANNMRLFEATGMGALLVTDRKANLGNYFSVGTEVLDYGDRSDLAHVLDWAQRHPGEAAAIAKRGMERTLRDHTYSNCIRTLSQILLDHLGRRDQARGLQPRA